MKKKIWDIYAPIYERAMRSDRKVYQKMYRRIGELVKDKDVLEVATGPGLLAKGVAANSNYMIATDYSTGMIKEAKKGAYPENLTFEVADAKALPYNDETFDIVIIANALHVMPNPRRALKEIKRVLKNGGTLVCPNFINHKNGIFSSIWSKVLSIAGIKFENQWTMDEYIDFIKANGWIIKYTEYMPARIPIAYVECVESN